MAAFQHLPPGRLGDYVERAYFGGNARRVQSMPARPFNAKRNPDPPLLKRSGVNRILLFPGSFNPPHRGHLDLLKFVYDNAPASLNIVAAIVVLTDDQRLTEKMSEDEYPMILTKKQRIALWRTQEFPQNWAWIYDKSQADWTQFRANLERSTQRDGINLKFILLGGPDNIGHGNIMDPGFWKCKDFITTDISRAVSFRAPNSLSQLSGHTNWQPVGVDRIAIERRIRTRVLNQENEAVDKAVTQEISRSIESWVCQRYFNPKGMVYFIPASLDSRPSNPPSSTHLRRIICDTVGDALSAGLADVALNPELLITYLRQMPPIQRQLRPAKPAEPTAEEIARAAYAKIVW